MLNLSDMTVLQGDLKSLSKENYQKLKKEIVELGFSSPIHVWDYNEKKFILDGTQRYRTLGKMQNEGWTIPPLPVVKVDAKDVNEAKKKVLALTSQYGKMEEQGLYEFIHDSDITLEDIEESFHFPEVNISKFKEEYFEDSADKEDVKEDKEYLVICECENETHQSALYEQLLSQGVQCKLL
jgi:ParB-like chromosome segregation protein Spo0J